MKPTINFSLAWFICQNFEPYFVPYLGMGSIAILINAQYIIM